MRPTATGRMQTNAPTACVVMLMLYREGAGNCYFDRMIDSHPGVCDESHGMRFAEYP
jgi:hypothetical protein